MKLFISVLALISHLFLVNKALKADPLTDEQVTRKIQCKSAYAGINKENLENCMAGKYELSKYIACGKANVNENYFNDCVKGVFSIEKYNECRTFDYPSNPDFAICLKSNLSFDHRNTCAKFNHQFFNHYTLKGPDCNNESVNLDSLKACLKKLNNYTEANSPYYDDLRFTLYKSSGFFGSSYVRHEWKDATSYANFLRNCYTVDSLIFKTCFDYFDDGKSGDLNRVDNCMKYQATTEDIKKCEGILTNSNDKNDIVDCLYEFHIAKMARETSEKLNASLKPAESDSMKASKQLFDDNRNKKKTSTVKSPAKTKHNGSGTKNH